MFNRFGYSTYLVEDKDGNAISHLFSLRGSDHKPKISFDVDTRNGDVWQIVGPVNTKPKEKYHPYIVDLLLDKNLVKELRLDDISVQHMCGKNLLPSDLSPEFQEKLRQERPELIGEKPIEQPIEQPEENSEIEESSKLKIYQGKYGKKRKKL